MKVVIGKRDLVGALARVVSVPERKGLIPTLSSVLIMGTGEVLRISATDLIVSVTTSAPAQVKTMGSARIPCKDFVDRVKAMPDGPLNLAWNDKDSRLTITAPGSPRRYVLAGHSAEDFPKLPGPNWSESSVLNTGQLRKLIGAVQDCISSDVTRPHLASMLLTWEGNTLQSQGTDGHRGARYTLTGSSTTVAPRKLLIPSKGVTELARALEAITEPEQILEIDQSGPDAHFRSGAWTLSLRCTDATFPPLDQVIPKTTLHVVVAARLALIDSVKSVRLAASEANGGVSFTLGASKCRVAAESSDKGAADDEIACDYDGAEVRVGLNSEYVISALETIDAEEVTIGLSGELDPVVFRAHAKDPPGVVVIMPMRLP